MGRITEAQKVILDSFECIRVREAELSLLSTIKGPKIEGEPTGIAELFCHNIHINDDKSGNLASYLILSPDRKVLLFFSIRCGELFEDIDFDRMKEVGDILQLMERASESQDAELIRQVQEKVAKGFEKGLTDYDFQKKINYASDVSTEPDKSVKRISEAYPGVELKFLGTNSNASSYWKTLGFLPKMGETLFWSFIIPKIEEMRNIVGCRFLYLFAADRNADNRLVNYYRNSLHIDSQMNLSANKPHFDYNSKFLYQEISELVKQKEYFFEHFNRDMEDFV